ncbi:hypothetical protein D9611_008371 [Ephemerocybe angulata]|uniref:Uncharacterized protein n=1 Tax=Ephemerocybe angulata TaxID=980116 RepID=A0A8H5BII9_9AGAR|nr:hypothetical protein D9611_008371 [Tulosesus angulatus]
MTQCMPRTPGGHPVPPVYAQDTQGLPGTPSGKPEKPSRCPGDLTGWMAYGVEGAVWAVWWALCAGHRQRSWDARSRRPEQLDGAGATSNEEVGNGRQKEDILDARTAAKNLVKRYVLPLGSLHLSLMAALGLWLWSDIRGFGNMWDTANDCAAEHVLISILGSHVPFASGALRIVSFVIYGLFLVPGLNLLLPIVVFLGFHYCARGSPPTIIKPGPRPRSRNVTIWGHLCDPPLRRVQAFIVRWWSMIPPVLGLLFLLAINLVFIIDIELTLKQNAHLQDPDEAKWGFGQILAILLLFMPLRDLAEALLARKMQKEMNLGLESAVNQKQWDAILAFVARGADPNIDMRGETTAIRAAYLSDRLDVVRALLDAGSDPSIESGPKRDTETIQRENKACLQILRSYDNRFLEGASALTSMMAKGCHVGVKLLLSTPGIVVNARDTVGRTPLSFAAECDDEAVVKLLLTAPGIDVNAPDTDGWTPLCFPTVVGYEAVVKLLLAAPGIDVNAPNTNGWTPLCFAAEYGREAVVKLLLAAPGINVNAPETDGQTPLTWAASKGKEAVVKLLLAAPGIDVNAPGTDGRTPLIFAARNGHQAVVKLLLATPRIDVNAADTGGWTALTWAVFTGEAAIVQALCAVPETIIDVVDVKRRLKNLFKGWEWEDPASKYEQEMCVGLLEEFVESKGGGDQDGSEGGEPSGGRRRDDP